MYVYIYMYMYIYICVCICICVMCTQHQSSLFCFSQSFQRWDQKKMTVWGYLKIFFHAEYLPGWLAMFLIKKKDFQR